MRKHSLMERNSLAENRVSLNIFNYHTRVEYENHTLFYAETFAKYR